MLFNDFMALDNRAIFFILAKSIFLLVAPFQSFNISAHSGGLIIIGPSEKSYIENTCPGKPNHRLSDGTYVDCLTESHAIEYERSKNWYESIGQSLYYATETNKKAGVVFIEVREDKRYLNRALKTIKAQGLEDKIDIWCLGKKHNLSICEDYQ